MNNSPNAVVRSIKNEKRLWKRLFLFSTPAIRILAKERNRFIWNTRANCIKICTKHFWKAAYRKTNFYNTPQLESTKTTSTFFWKGNPSKSLVVKGNKKHF